MLVCTIISSLASWLTHCRHGLFSIFTLPLIDLSKHLFAAVVSPLFFRSSSWVSLIPMWGLNRSYKSDLYWLMERFSCIVLSTSIITMDRHWIICCRLCRRIIPSRCRNVVYLTFYAVDFISLCALVYVALILEFWCDLHMHSIIYCCRSV